MKERKGGKYFYHNSRVLGWGGDYRIQLEIARSGFSFDISFYPAKMDSIDKAKPSGRMVNEGVVNERGPLRFSRGMINSHLGSKFPPSVQIFF
jgi:hypothetical protein